MNQLDGLLDRPIAFHRCFLQLTSGSTSAAILLSQAWYWSARTKDSDGWFYKTEEDWEEETGLTRRQQQRGRDQLKQCDFWEEQRKGVPAKLFFRLDRAKILAALGVSPVAPNGATGCTERGGQLHQTVQQDAPNGATFKEAEITTEITTETTTGSERLAFSRFSNLFEKLLGFTPPHDKMAKECLAGAVKEWGGDAVEKALARWAKTSLGDTYTKEGGENRNRKYAVKNFVEALPDLVAAEEEAEASPEKKKKGLPWL